MAVLRIRPNNHNSRLGTLNQISELKECEVKECVLGSTVRTYQ